MFQGLGAVPMRRSGGMSPRSTRVPFLGQTPQTLLGRRLIPESWTQWFSSSEPDDVASPVDSSFPLTSGGFTTPSGEPIPSDGTPPSDGTTFPVDETASPAEEATATTETGTPQFQPQGRFVNASDVGEDDTSVFVECRSFNYGSNFPEGRVILFKATKGMRNCTAMPGSQGEAPNCLSDAEVCGLLYERSGAAEEGAGGEVSPTGGIPSENVVPQGEDGGTPTAPSYAPVWTDGVPFCDSSSRGYGACLKMLPGAANGCVGLATQAEYQACLQANYDRLRGVSGGLPGTVETPTTGGTLPTGEGPVADGAPTGGAAPGDGTVPPGGTPIEGGGTLLPDGRILLPGGGILMPDGTTYFPGGGILYPDGQTIPSGGWTVLPGGGTLLPGGGIQLQDGRTVMPEDGEIMTEPLPATSIAEKLSGVATVGALGAIALAVAGVLTMKK